MPISSQFSLSLELTKLIPLQPIASGVTQALMFLARELRGSGSDIVVEEDLATLFRPFRIDCHMESTFRTVVGKSAVSTKLCDSILLRFGPGPTVSRALTHEAYFPMVIQCSLLTSVHERAALAAAIASIFEKKGEGAPPEHILDAVPSHDGLIGVLRACEEQTAAFNWSNFLTAVAAKMNIPIERASEALPSTILRGAITMLPFAQTLPGDRLIVIVCDSGVCLLAVWVHHLLGLTVLVRTYAKSIYKEVRFGSGQEQVIIDDRLDINRDIEEPSITLMNASDHDKIFSIKLEPDEVPIQGIFKRPAKGYGAKMLEPCIRDLKNKDVMITEMMFISTAMALRLSRLFFMLPRANTEPLEYFENEMMDFDTDNSDSYSSGELESGGQDLLIDDKRVLEAAILLFDRAELKGSRLEKYSALYSESRYNSKMEPRGAIAELLELCFKSDEDAQLKYFDSIVPTLRHLTILILAFAHLEDLESASELPLSCLLQLIEHHILAGELVEWDGKRHLPIPEDAWFHAIAILMVGHAYEVDLLSTSLVSDRGWSLYLNTYAASDPSITQKGRIMVQRGVPYRNGVWKHCVTDAPTSEVDSRELRTICSSGEEISSRSTNSTKYAKALVGQGPDKFIINLRITTEQDGKVITRRTGYRELCSALWLIARSSRCRHRSFGPEKLILPESCILVSPESTDRSKTDVKVVICQTSGNKAARWLALLTIAHRRQKQGNSWKDLENIMLRENDCCLKCAINQVKEKEGNWILIL
jgi:hypothetical protein